MGIGFGIVKRFAEAGANVVIADVSDIGKEKSSLVAKEYGVKTLFVKTDVSDEKSVKNLVSKTVKAFGAIDVMVNDAGIYPNVPVMQMDVKTWERTQTINLRGVFLCCKEAAGVMIKNGGGNIVNIASVDAIHPSMVGLAAYDASKHGVWGFTKNFALEVCGNNIRVNAVAPGAIAIRGEHDRTNPRVPLGYSGTPVDIANAMIFLASDKGGYITGQTIIVDGAFSLAHTHYWIKKGIL